MGAGRRTVLALAAVDRVVGLGPVRVPTVVQRQTLGSLRLQEAARALKHKVWADGTDGVADGGEFSIC